MVSLIEWLYVTMLMQINWEIVIAYGYEFYMEITGYVVLV